MTLTRLILALAAGPDLDAHLAQTLGEEPSVFDCPQCHDEQGYYGTRNPTAPSDSDMIRYCKACSWEGPGAECFTYPAYSTNRELALELLDDWHGDFNILRQNGHYKVSLYEPSMQGDEWDASLPLAICRIVLRSTGWPLATHAPLQKGRDS